MPRPRPLPRGQKTATRAQRRLQPLEAVRAGMGGGRGVARVGSTLERWSVYGVVHVGVFVCANEDDLLPAVRHMGRRDVITV